MGTGRDLDLDGDGDVYIDGDGDMYVNGECTGAVQRASQDLHGLHVCQQRRHVPGALSSRPSKLF